MVDNQDMVQKSKLAKLDNSKYFKLLMIKKNIETILCFLF